MDKNAFNVSDYRHIPSISSADVEAMKAREMRFTYGTMFCMETFLFLVSIPFTSC